MPRAKRTRVGYPLSPQIFIELGEIVRVGFTSKDVNNPEWKKLFRIYTNHGYRESGNVNDGYLKLTKSRIGTVEDNSWTLDVEQKIVQREANVNLIKATINYSYQDSAFVLNDWKSSSNFFSPEGVLLSDVSSDESSGSLGAIHSENSVIPDWCLFDQVLQFPRIDGFAVEFTMLEGLSLLKSHQVIKYRGEELITLSDGSQQRLQRFTQTGSGVLPYDYWLDEHGDLGLVVTLSRAYILDSNAEKLVADHAEYELDKYKTRKREFESRMQRRSEEVAK